MECLTEDVDVVLAGTKENQKSPHLEWAQWLLVKQPADFTATPDIQVIAQSLTAPWLFHYQTRTWISIG